MIGAVAGHDIENDTRGLDTGLGVEHGKHSMITGFEADREIENNERV